MKIIHFKINKNLATYHRYENKKDSLYDEIWIPENQIKYLKHESVCGKDYYFVNDNFVVDKEEFNKILKQLGE